MAKICSSSCVDDEVRIPVRTSYINLYKWPESEAEFMKSASEGGGTPLVESISCRQMYLRSYTFSRKETLHQRTMKCLVKVREKVTAGRKDNAELRSHKRHPRRKLHPWFDVFWRFLFCAAAVDVVDHGV